MLPKSLEILQRRRIRDDDSRHIGWVGQRRPETHLQEGHWSWWRSGRWGWHRYQEIQTDCVEELRVARGVMDWPNTGIGYVDSRSLVGNTAATVGLITTAFGPFGVGVGFEWPRKPHGECSLEYKLYFNRATDSEEDNCSWKEAPCEPHHPPCHLSYHPPTRLMLEETSISQLL